MSTGQKRKKEKEKKARITVPGGRWGGGKRLWARAWLGVGRVNGNRSSSSIILLPRKSVFKSGRQITRNDKNTEPGLTFSSLG